MRKLAFSHLSAFWHSEKVTKEPFVRRKTFLLFQLCLVGMRVEKKTKKMEKNVCVSVCMSLCHQNSAFALATQEPLSCPLQIILCFFHGNLPIVGLEMDSK